MRMRETAVCHCLQFHCFAHGMKYVAQSPSTSLELQVWTPAWKKFCFEICARVGF